MMQPRTKKIFSRLAIVILIALVIFLALLSLVLYRMCLTLLLKIPPYSWFPEAATQGFHEGFAQALRNLFNIR